MATAPMCKICKARHWGLEHKTVTPMQTVTRPAVSEPVETVTQTVTTDTVTEIARRLATDLALTKGGRGLRVYASNSARQAAYRGRKHGSR